MSLLRRIGSSLLCLQCGMIFGWAETATDADPEVPTEAPAPAPVAEDDWKIDVDRFLENYLPRVDVRAPADEPIDDWVFELPEFEVEAEFDDARVKKALPERWDILSNEAKKRILAQKRLTVLETKVLNRWIFWWGVRPEDYLLAREERERARAYKARNAQLLKQLEAIRPELLKGNAE